jgi:Skp family chaperone for outer membrane proteins
MEAQEMGETPEEETREGTEDGASMTNSRKRSPKGAKNTKAPMDADCGTCKSGKPCSCKAKKDGGCGSYGKRGDALTPKEYLAACDLGIQDRSRPYIRARLDTAMNLTPSTVRADLKCGKGSISEGEKCSKGSAQKAKSIPGPTERRGAYGTSGLGGDPFSYKNMANKGAMLNAAALGGIGGLIGGGKGALIGAAVGGLAGAASGAGQAGMNRISSNAAKRSRLRGELEAPIKAEYKANKQAIKAKGNASTNKLATKLTAEFQKAKANGASRKELNELEQKQAMAMNREFDKQISQYNKNRKNRNEKLAKGYAKIKESTKGRYGVDSVYADGFTPDFDQLAI